MSIKRNINQLVVLDLVVDFDLFLPSSSFRAMESVNERRQKSVPLVVSIVDFVVW